MSNLLPPQEKRHLVSLYKKRLAVVVFRFVMLLCVIFTVFLLPSYLFSKNQESSLLSQKKLLESRETSELKQSLVDTIQDINQKTSIFKTDPLNSPVVASFIGPILKSKLVGIHITNLSFDTEPNTKSAKVQINGLASSREAILAFGDNLRKQSEITSVDIPIANFIKENNIPFFVNISVNLK